MDLPAFQTFLHMVKMLFVSRIDKDLCGAIDQIGIAIVCSHRFPDEGVDVIFDFHKQRPLYIGLNFWIRDF